MKRKILCLALAGVTLFSVCACTMPGGSSNSSTNGEEYQFETVFSNTDKVTLSSGESENFAINKDIVGKEYIKLTLKTNANLLGEFTYRNVADSSQIVKEQFFIEPSSETIQFKQFLDAFRYNGVGLFDKHLISITLKNLDAHSAEVQLSNVSVSDRDVPGFEKEIYIEKDSLR